MDSFVLVFKNKSLFIVDKNAKMYTCRKKAMNKTVTLLKASLVAQMVKMQETRVQPLGQEDPLEKGKATHSSILAWRIPWGHRVGHD